MVGYIKRVRNAWNGIGESHDSKYPWTFQKDRPINDTGYYEVKKIEYEEIEEDD